MSEAARLRFLCGGNGNKKIKIFFKKCLFLEIFGILNIDECWRHILTDLRQD